MAKAVRLQFRFPQSYTYIRKFIKTIYSTGHNTPQLLMINK